MNTKRYEWMLEDSEPCDCDRCKEMCKTPCWGLPHEIEAIMEAGFGHMLMHDYWYAQLVLDDDDNIIGGGFQTEIICPASEGHALQRAPWFSDTNCLFLDRNKHCILHDSGLKPYEGRVCRHDIDTPDNHRKRIRDTWADADGTRVSRSYFKDELDDKQIVLTVGGIHGHTAE